MPRVVVISPYYNREQFVQRTMESLATQTYADFQAIFVDDGSTDGTFETMERFAGGRVTCRTQVNAGFTNTMIETIAGTDSEYVAVQGSGDISHPARLEKQVGLLDSDPDIVLVGCHRRIVSEVDGEVRHARPHIETDQLAQLIAENPFSQGEIVMRRAAYEKAGGYRAFFKFRQDLDLWMRMATHGKFAVLPEEMYTVFVLRESVSSDVRKLALAMAYRDFAIYCALERRAGRKDPLDQLGPAAALVRPRSRTLARNLAFAAQRRAIRGEKEEALYLLDASRREALTLASVKAQLLLAVPYIAQLRRSYRRLKGSQRTGGQPAYGVSRGEGPR